MIGIFDSGLGGLSVRKELAKLMPDQDFCYIADSAYCPYGRKSPQELQNRCRKLANILIGQGNCDLIVVACNTATAAAIEVLRSEYSIPFVGMEPAIKPALLHSKTGIVGVLATYGTFKGALYHRTLTEFQGDIKVIEQIGDGLVELVEQNKTESNEARDLLTKYLTPMIDASVDHIVLGCTHYPFLIPMMGKILDKKDVGDKIKILNPAPAVALQTQRILDTLKLSHQNKKKRKFYSTGDEKVLKDFVNTIVENSPSNLQKILGKLEVSYEHVDI